MDVKIKRDDQDATRTLGKLFINGVPTFETLELPWEENKPDISCIPVGKYICRKINSPHFGVVFQILDVPGRENILIHKGNFPKDTHGCVLLGNKREEDAILGSSTAFNNFMMLMENIDAFGLEIV